MQIKLAAAFLAVLLASTSAGCLWFQGTQFTLLDSTISDSGGFPVLSLSFNLSDYATLSMTDPTGNQLQGNEFYQGVHTTQIVLGSYRTNPTTGIYTLTVKDVKHSTIATHTFSFASPQVNISSCKQAWFHGSNETILTLNLTVSNKGQLPFYPKNLTVMFGDTPTTSRVLPTVILPQDSTPVTAILLVPHISTNIRMTISLIDDQGASWASNTQTISSEVCPSLEYSWYYRGHHQLTLPNATALYWYGRSLPREQTQDYALYVFNALDDGYLTFVLHRLTAISGSIDSIERLNFIAGFVQSLDYREDDPLNESVEYPRYPIETLNEHGGDCEDKAILCAQLLTLAGYNVSLLRIPNHMAVGVHFDSLEGYTPFADGYYFLEATAGFSPVGRVPGEYQGETNFTVYKVIPRPLLVHDWLNATHYQSSSADYVRVSMLVKNLGSLSASVEVRGFFASGSTQYGVQQFFLPTLDAGSTCRTSLRVNVPKGIATLLKTQMICDGVVQDERESASMFD
jgi:hypothetical protein